ncbi:MAG: class I SAM-dependent methyltransferase, partial [Pseudomonadota bacterium]
MTLRTRWRRFRMGMATLAGRPQGFFSPYRYAGAVQPTVYPELEARFRAAEPRMAEILAAIDAAMADLVGLDGPPPTPRWRQHWFPRLDGAAAHAIVSAMRPAEIVEVGSGHSTRMLAHAAAWMGTRITCIDPQPRAVLDALDIQWERRVLAPGDVARFASLQAGDIAFFDSSHLLWPGSDVDLILNRILPVLAPGVLVHL